MCRRASVGEDATGCIKSIKDALSSCSIKQRLRWLEKLSAAVPDAWASLKADISLFQADDTVKEALLGWSHLLTFFVPLMTNCLSCIHGHEVESTKPAQTTH